MNNQKPKAILDAKEFFSNELKTLIHKTKITIDHEATNYLADLMVRYMDSKVFFAHDEEGRPQHNVLADLYSEYLNATHEQQKVVLRRLGDLCLMVSGFFPDSLNRKLVDLDYYFGMGGKAYWQLSELQLSVASRTLFKELSLKFKLLAEVLGELSNRSGLQTNTDLLRTYEKWLITGSDRLKALLSEKGIQAVHFDNKTRH